MSENEDNNIHGKCLACGGRGVDFYNKPCTECNGSGKEENH